MSAGLFPVIVADPPWPFIWQGAAGGRRRSPTTLGYTPMDPAAICDLDVPAAPDAVLFLWATQEMIHAGIARDVALAWGFPNRSGELVWCKPNFGAGAFPRAGHETCMVYTRGTGALAAAPRDVHSVQVWSQPRVKARGSGGGGKMHSAKPDGFYDLVERACEGPYLEMFARRARFGWEYAGDGSLGTVTIPGLREPTPC